MKRICSRIRSSSDTATDLVLMAMVTVRSAGAAMMKIQTLIVTGVRRTLTRDYFKSVSNTPPPPFPPNLLWHLL